MQKTQRGFIIPLVILIVAALAVGGGVYYSKNKGPSKNKMGDESNNASTTVKANADASVVMGGKGNGSIRSLLALGKDTMCTYTTTSAQGTMSGTMYISGTMMRGDFQMKSGTSAAVDSHMIKTGDTVYTWSGTQGAKMDMAMTGNSSNANLNASQKSTMDLDQKVDYDCQSWSKDASKFVVPTTVKFVDVSAMMKKAGVSATTTVGGSLNTTIKDHPEWELQNGEPNYNQPR